MEKKDKIIIGGLVIVIIALIVGLAFMVMGSNLSNNSGTAPEGMKMYDFGSEFKMAVPKDVKFLKSWNNSDDAIFNHGYSYFDKNNEINIVFADSPLVTHEVVDALIEVDNASGNVTFEFDGDLIIAHNKTANGKVGKTAEKSNFTERILLQNGHRFVRISGNDLDLMKSMINTIEFYE